MALDITVESVVRSKNLSTATFLAFLFVHQAYASEELLVVVGQLVKIDEAPDPCPTPNKEGDSNCTQFDSLYEATYNVLDVIVGSSGKSQVSFEIADHNGFPEFAEFKYALLFIDVSNDEAWLHKYQGYAVHRTETGRWASCGNPYDDRMGDEPRYLAPISFVSPLRNLGESSIPGVMNRLDERYIEVEGDLVVCRKGVYLEDLYTMVREGVFKARGVEAPVLSAGDF